MRARVYPLVASFHRREPLLTWQAILSFNLANAGALAMLARGVGVSVPHVPATLGAW